MDANSIAASNATSAPAAHPAPLSLVVDVPEAARLLGIGQSTVWQYLAEGRIKLTKIGRRSVIARTEIERIAIEGC